MGGALALLATVTSCRLFRGGSSAGEPHAGGLAPSSVDSPLTVDHLTDLSPEMKAVARIAAMRCKGCHNEARRELRPYGDHPQLIASRAPAILKRVVAQGDMPPGGLPPKEREAFRSALVQNEESFSLAARSSLPWAPPERLARYLERAELRPDALARAQKDIAAASDRLGAPNSYLGKPPGKTWSLDKHLTWAEIAHRACHDHPQDLAQRQIFLSWIAKVMGRAGRPSDEELFSHAAAQGKADPVMLCFATLTHLEFTAR